MEANHKFQVGDLITVRLKVGNSINELHFILDFEPKIGYHIFTIKCFSNNDWEGKRHIAKKKWIEKFYEKT